MDRSKLATNYDITYDELEILREVFNLLPKYEENKVDFRELKHELEQLDIPRVSAQLEPIRMKDNMDLLNWKQFQDVIAKVSGNPDSQEFAEETFKSLDYTNKGNLTFQDLKQYSDEAKLNIMDDTLKNMIKIADSNGDGAVTFSDTYKEANGWQSVILRSLYSSKANSLQASLQHSLMNSLQNSLVNSRRGSHD